MSTTSRRSLKRAAAGVSAGVLTLSGFAAIATPATAQSNFSLQRQAGADRYLTAAQIATNAFTTADTVLIASGEAGHFADALTGNFLAGRTGSPVLLTAGDALPKATSDALATLKATKVTILGGTAAVSQKVQDALAANYTVTRIGGANRYATGAQVAAAGGTVGQTESKGATAFLASGLNFADALVAGGPAYAGRLPVAVTDANTLSPETSQSLTDLAIKNVVIVGGTSAVSQKVEDAVKAKSITVTRLAGTTRQATAAAVANYATGTASGLGFSKALVDLATGADFADALVGGPSAGKDKAPLLLAVNANTLGADTTNYLTANSATLTGGKVFGGTAAVSNTAVTAAQNAGRTAPASNQTLSVTPNTTATAPTSAVDDPNTTVDESKADERTFTVNGLDDTKTYTVALFDAKNVVTGSNGQVTFVDTTPDNNQADGFGDTTSAQIIKKNSQATGPAGSTTVSPVNGSLNFTINGSAPGSVVPVVFLDTNSNSQVDLNADNTPSEAFGLGGTTTFTAPNAVSSANGDEGQVSQLDKAANRIGIDTAPTTGNADYAASGTDFSYTYDANDSFAVLGVPKTMDEFEAALSRGDYLTTGAYSTNSALQSVFNISYDSPEAPTTVVAEKDVLKTNEITVTVTPSEPTTVSNYDSFVIQRATVTGGTDELTDGAVGTYSTIATVNSADDASTLVAGFQYVDKAVAVGTYRYRAAGVVDGQQGAYKADTNNESSVAPGADTTAPVSQYLAVVTDANFQNEADGGDVYRVIFDEPVSVGTGDTLRLLDGVNATQDAGEEAFNITVGTNATATTNSSAVTIGATTYEAGRVVTLTLTAAPAAIATVTGGDGRLNYPATVVNQSGYTDTAGNSWALAGDVALNRDLAAPSITGTAGDASDNQIVLNYSAPVSVVNTAGSLGQFSYDDTGSAPVAPTAIAVNGSTVTLTFAAGQLVAADNGTLTYTASATASDNVQGLSGRSATTPQTPAATTVVA